MHEPEPNDATPFLPDRHTQRGQAIEDSGLAPVVVATIHPSAILRRRTDEERIAEREAFAVDLAVVATALG